MEGEDTEAKVDSVTAAKKRKPENEVWGEKGETLEELISKRGFLGSRVERPLMWGKLQEISRMKKVHSRKEIIARDIILETVKETVEICTINKEL